ncbi:5-oxoprolinase subunit C family protein [Pedococcus sp. P5_B7]
MNSKVEVLTPGPLSTVQDLGRPGHFSSGVPESGALDSGSMRLANRLVGNEVDRPGLETTYGGLHLRFHGPAVVAVTGAVVDVHRGGRAVCSHQSLYVPPGCTLRLGTPLNGLRNYVAFRGGLQGALMFGSLSTDLLSGLGAPLSRGQMLTIGAPSSRPVPAVDFVPFSANSAEAEVRLRIIYGPRHDWFTQSALTKLTSTAWAVDARSNRIGIRLAGPALRRRIGTELPSEGVVKGAVQVPADGQPIIFLNDHPVTGGYPVIAVVVENELDVLAQCRPGQVVRFESSAPSPTFDERHA